MTAYCQILIAKRWIEGLNLRMAMGGRLQSRVALGFWLTLLSLVFSLNITRAETKLDFWHSYKHQPSGVIHYSFQIANYKRGLFFGSCGPCTRSLQWEYDIDLAGAGPVYEKDQIKITSETKSVDVISGSVRVDPKRNEAILNLQVRSEIGVLAFRGNGTYAIEKVK